MTDKEIELELEVQELRDWQYFIKGLISSVCSDAQQDFINENIREYEADILWEKEQDECQ